MENKLYEIKWKEIEEGEVVDNKKTDLTMDEVQELLKELFIKGIIDFRFTELPKRVRLKDYREFEINKEYKMGDMLVKFDGDMLLVSKIYENWFAVYEYDQWYIDNMNKELYLINE